MKKCTYAIVYTDDSADGDYFVKLWPLDWFLNGGVEKVEEGWRALCPFSSCRNQLQDQCFLYIHPSNTWRCSHCLKGGNIIDFIMYDRLCDKKEALDFLNKIMELIVGKVNESNDTTRS